MTREVAFIGKPSRSVIVCCSRGVSVRARTRTLRGACMSHKFVVTAVRRQVVSQLFTGNRSIHWGLRNIEDEDEGGGVEYGHRVNFQTGTLMPFFHHGAFD